MNRDAAPPLDTPPLPADAPPDTLDTDLPCWQCGYNLRSLPHQGACPECGLDIQRSLSGDRLVFSSTRWLRMLAHGSTWLLASTILNLMLSVVWLLFSRLTVYYDALQIAAYVPTLLLAIGATLLTRPEPGRITAQGATRHFAFWAIWSALLMSLLLLPLRFLGPTLYISLYALRGVIYTLGLVALLLHLAALLKRSTPTSLPNQARLLALANLAVLALFLARNLITILSIHDIIDFTSMLYQVSSFITRSVYYVLLIWFLIFLILTRTHLLNLWRFARSYHH